MTNQAQSFLGRQSCCSQLIKTISRSVALRSAMVRRVSSDAVCWLESSLFCYSTSKYWWQQQSDIAGLLLLLLTLTITNFLVIQASCFCQHLINRRIQGSASCFDNFHLSVVGFSHVLSMGQWTMIKDNLSSELPALQGLR